jgi:hypothetical protein
MNGATRGSETDRSQFIECMPVNRWIIPWRSLHLRDRVQRIGGQVQRTGHFPSSIHKRGQQT